MSSGYDDREFLHQRGFRRAEPRGVFRPFHVDGDQVLGGVGPDVGEPVGELDGARLPAERTD
jgi:hypothetical protein